MKSSPTRRARPVGVARGVEVAHLAAHLGEPPRVEGRQPHLHRADVVPPRVVAEVHVEPLGQRDEPLHALVAVEERGRPRDQRGRARGTARVDVVDPLAERAEALLPHVASASAGAVSTSSSTSTSPLRPVCRSIERSPRRKALAARVVDLALEARRALDVRAHVGLPHQPRQQPLLGGVVARGARACGTPAGPRRRRAASGSPPRGASPAATTPRATGPRRRWRRSPRASTRPPPGRRTTGSPASETPRRPTRGCGGSPSRGGTRSPMRWSGVSVSLICTSEVAKPAACARCWSQRTKKVLPAPVVAAHGLEDAVARRGHRELVVERAREAVEPRRERLDAAAGTVPLRSAATTSRRTAIGSALIQKSPSARPRRAAPCGSPRRSGSPASRRR
jgi:hypothetical protein